jgi:hypothetical protein
LEARAAQLIATICGGVTSCVEAREWAAFEAKDPMVRASQDPLLLMQHITPFLRGAAVGRWPPRARLSVSMKGGGHPFAALSVGSRGVVKL